MPPDPARQIRDKVEKEIVRPLFERVRQTVKPDTSLPKVVADNRRTRAYARVLDALVSRGAESVPDGLQMRIRPLVHEWAARSFDDAFTPIEEFEIDCAREYDLVLAKQSGDPEEVLRVHEQEHRRRIVERFGRIELRGIQISHRITSEIDKIYVPLHVQAIPETSTSTTVVPFERRIPVSIALQHRRIMLIGAPGSGKSTLVSWLATGLADGRLESQIDGVERPFPLVLVVRTVTTGRMSVAEMAKSADLDEAVVERVLEEGRLWLLIDGLDEAPAEVRADLIGSVQQALKQYPSLSVVVTSRPAGASGAIEHALDGFRALRLTDLTQDEVDQFVDKWCLAAETSVRKDLAEAAKEAADAAEDLKGRIKRSRSVQRIAANPLLTTILCMVHRFLGRSIPEHRVALYERCTDVLLYDWDRAKFPEGSAVAALDAPQKRSLLRRVARRMHDGHVAELAADDVVSEFEEALPGLGKPPGDARKIVDMIRDRSGLLVERRPGYFGFSHLTFQEYFTAIDYAACQELDDLAAHWSDPWWHEVIALAAGVPGADAEHLVEELTKIESNAALFLAAQCLETATDLSLALRELIQSKLRNLVPPTSHAAAMAVDGLGVLVAPHLVRALATAGPDETMYCLLALRHIDYEPAIAAILNCTRQTFKTSAQARNMRRPLTTGEYALAILAYKSRQSESASRAFRSAISRGMASDLAETLADLAPAQLQEAIFTAARREQPSSSPAQNTA